jgi:hypothetical protein
MIIIICGVISVLSFCSLFCRAIVAMGDKNGKPIDPGASYQPKLRSEREAAQARYQALMSAQAEREAPARARRAANRAAASSDLGAAFRNRDE